MEVIGLIMKLAWSSCSSAWAEVFSWARWWRNTVNS